ncbi:chitin deacetylase 1 [Phlyctochytrium arcticum]|nr:chitin deacetylase 1 [Phlyctochytrium arcticum]
MGASGIIPAIIAFLATSASISVHAQQNPLKQCVSAQTPLDFSSFPEPWVTAGTGMINTPEFQQLKARIDWSKIPKIPPRPAPSPQGPLNTTSYNITADPDCWWTATGCIKPKLPDVPPDISKCPQPGRQFVLGAAHMNNVNLPFPLRTTATLGYTFDDGPNCTQPYLYDFFAANNQKVDLFYIGSNVRFWPDAAKRGAEAGHHIAVHTWSHPLLTSLSNDDVLAELYYTKKIIKFVTGLTPKYFRPPQGDVDDRVRAIAWAIGLQNIQWNIDSFDWQMKPMGAKTPAEIDANFQGWIDKLNNGTFGESGAISLEHESNEYTMNKAIEWYPKIKAAFKHIMPVVSCHNIAHPYEETTVTFAGFDDVAAGKPASIVRLRKKSAASTLSPGWGLALLLTAAYTLRTLSA